MLDPEALAWLAHRRLIVLAALDHVPELQRRTLEIAFFEGLTYPEIAEREGVPLGTIKSRAARALAALRVALEDDLDPVPDAPGQVERAGGPGNARSDNPTEPRPIR